MSPLTGISTSGPAGIAAAGPLEETITLSQAKTLIK